MYSVCTYDMEVAMSQMVEKMMQRMHFVVDTVIKRDCIQFGEKERERDLTLPRVGI